MVRPKRFGFVQVPHLLYCTLECSVHGYWNGCGVGWSDLALFCHVRKREHCCRSGTFLKAQFRKKWPSLAARSQQSVQILKSQRLLLQRTIANKKVLNKKRVCIFWAPKWANIFGPGQRKTNILSFSLFLAFQKNQRRHFPLVQPPKTF